MYARSTTIHGEPVRIADGIGYVHDEVLPDVLAMDGCLGLSMLCDRDSGRCIVTTSWGSEESMHASEEQVHALRERARDVFGGVMDVQEWEIGLLHRAHQAPEGACCRVAWIRGDPARLDDVLSSFRMGVLPRLDDLPGFCSVSVMVDRDRGLCAVTASYDDRESMMRSSGDVRSMRERFTREMGMEITDMAEFELTIHHLRVPELV